VLGVGAIIGYVGSALEYKGGLVNSTELNASNLINLRNEIMNLRKEFSELSNKYTEDRIIRTRDIDKVNNTLENLGQSIGRLQGDVGSSKR
jgi:hypothetical protein